MKKRSLIWLIGCLFLVALASRSYHRRETADPRPVPTPSLSRGLVSPLTFETFDQIRNLNPLTTDGRLLDSAAPQSYETWKMSGEALAESVEEGTGLVGDFNHDGVIDRALPIVQDEVIYLVVASRKRGRWYLPGHCFTRLDLEDVLSPHKLRDLAIDACVIEEREEYALLWRFWERDLRAGENALQAGELEQALRLLERSLEEARKVDHPLWRVYAAQSLQAIAQLHIEAERPEECLQSHRQSVKLLEGETDHSEELENAYRKLARELALQGKAEESASVFLQALHQHDKNRCGYSPDVVKTDILLEIAKTYSRAGRREKALSFLRKCEDSYRTAYFAPGMHRDVPAYALALAREYRTLGDLGKATALCQYGLECWPRLQGAPPEDQAALKEELKSLQTAQGRP